MEETSLILVWALLVSDCVTWIILYLTSYISNISIVIIILYSVLVKTKGYFTEITYPTTGQQAKLLIARGSIKIPNGWFNFIQPQNFAALWTLVLVNVSIINMILKSNNKHRSKHQWSENWILSLPLYDFP